MMDRSIVQRLDAAGLQHISISNHTHIHYMPLPAAKQVTCPVLIVHGDKDAHVPAEHASMLAKVMRLGGNNDVTLTIFSDHNHLLLEDTNGSISGYSQLLMHTNQLSDHVLSIITEWLVLKLGR